MLFGSLLLREGEETVMAKRSGWIWVMAALVSALIVSSYIGVYYYMEYTRYQQLYRNTLRELAKYERYMFVNLLFDYGNGTRTWRNGTLVPIGATLFEATKTVADIEYTKYSWGVFITSMNGVRGDQSHGWLWHVWNSTRAKWDFGPVGADAFILKNGDTVSWVYTSW